MRNPRPMSKGRDRFPPTNPPYGVRLEDRDRARATMKQRGETLRARFGGWDAAVLAGSPDSGLELGIRAERVHTVWNGALECRLLRLHVSAESAKTLIHTGHSARIDVSLAETPGAKMFANRIAKNLRQLAKWAEPRAWRISTYEPTARSTLSPSTLAEPSLPGVV